MGQTGCCTSCKKSTGRLIKKEEELDSEQRPQWSAGKTMEYPV